MISFAPIPASVVFIGADAHLGVLRPEVRRWRLHEVGSEDRDGLRRLPVLLVVAPSLGDPEVQRRVDGILTLHPSPPVILVTDFSQSNARHLATRPTVNLCWTMDDAYVFTSTIARAVGQGYYWGFHSRIIAAIPTPPHWLIRRSLAVLFARSPGKEGQTVRSVQQLASRVGCSPEHLSRLTMQSGFRLGRLVRWVVLLDGIILRRLSGESWTTVSGRLGFPTLSAWSQFSRSLCGISPRDLEQTDPQEWVERAVADCLAHSIRNPQMAS